MCENRRGGCYYLNGEICRDPDCVDRVNAMKLLKIEEFLRNAPVSPEAVPDAIMKILVGEEQR